MKKLYIKPEIEKILLERTDIITGSNVDDGNLTNTTLNHMDVGNPANTKDTIGW